MHSLSSYLHQASLLFKKKLKRRKEETKRFIEYKRLKRVRKLSVPAYSECKNCGETLHGMYCAKCGQYALDVNQHFGAYLKQFMANTYQLDGKIVQTLRFLITTPGHLSKEFLEGKISSYVHPLKLYMFLSVIFFSFVLIIYDDDKIVDTWSNGAEKVLRDSVKAEGTSGKQLSIAINPIATNADSLSSGKTRQLEEKLTKSLNLTSREKKMIYHEAFAFVTSYTPFILLLLIPVYGAFLRIGFRKSMPNYMHNLVFAFHIHSFFLILLSIGVLITYYLHWPVLKVIFPIFIVYHVLSVHKVYKRGWIVSFRKTILTLGIYSFVLSLFTLLLIIWVAYKIGSNLDITF